LCLHAAGLARSTPTFSRYRARMQPLVEELPSIVALLAGEDATARLRGITNLRKSAGNEGSTRVPVRVVWEALLPHVVPLTWPGAGAEAVQFQALWTLTNLALADGWCEQLMALGAAHAALATLQQEVAGLDVREQAVWLLGNLLGERGGAGEGACDLCRCEGGCVATLVSPHGSWMRRAGDARTHGAVVALPRIEPALAAQFRPVGVSLDVDGGVVRESAGLSLVRNATWVCSNVFRHLPAERVSDFRGLLRLMAAGLRSTDLDVRVDSCWALSYAAEKEGGVELLLETVSRAKQMVRQSRVAPALSTIHVCAVRAAGAAGGVPGIAICCAGDAGVAPLRDHDLSCVVMRPCVRVRQVIYYTALRVRRW
jgi:hypothetical protein